MNCHWEELTSLEFAKAVKRTKGVCIVPIGCLEKHGDHLPLGTDAYAARKIAELAVQKAPAIIFPFHYLGTIHEGKHWPGALALASRLVLEVMENICEEIARNGMKKIIILNHHGGNERFLGCFLSGLRERKHDFQVYLIRLQDYFRDPRDKELLSTRHGHAGEGETSSLLIVRPDLVHLARATPEPKPLGRLKHLPPVATAYDWYADWPEHYAGDGARATAAKGRLLLNRQAEKVARVIEAVRRDTALKKLQDQFFSGITH